MILAINSSLGCFPNSRLLEAADRVVQGTSEPFLGVINSSIIQIVPQLFGKITHKEVDLLFKKYPDKELRLHANVRVLDKHVIADCSNVREYGAYFKELAFLNQHLRGKVYTLHAGRRSNSTFSQMIDSAKSLEDLMQCPVGIEGHYPTPNDTYLVSSWKEYEQLFQSQISYVMDLSHINILVQQTKLCRLDLLKEMCKSPRCLEIHVSSNNGKADSHYPLVEKPWWWFLFEQGYINTKTVIFSEGKQ
jgi:hypothetical protein